MTFADALFQQINNHINRLNNYGLLDDIPMFDVEESFDNNYDSYEFNDLFDLTNRDDNYYDNMDTVNDTVNNINTQSTSTSTLKSSGISNEMLKVITEFEGTPWGKTLSRKELNGYGRDKEHKTYGYGLLYHPETNKFMDQVQKSYTQTELQNLMLIDISNRVKKIKNWASKNNITLNQNQIDAITSAVYNFGIGFLNSKIAKMIIKNPNDPNIKNAWTHMSDEKAKKYNLSGLKKRRSIEANWYFTGHK